MHRVFVVSLKVFQLCNSSVLR